MSSPFCILRRHVLFSRESCRETRSALLMRLTHGTRNTQSNKALAVYAATIHFMVVWPALPPKQRQTQLPDDAGFGPGLDCNPIVRNHSARRSAAPDSGELPFGSQ